jgi:hypothetical protein
MKWLWSEVDELLTEKQNREPKGSLRFAEIIWESVL